MKDLYWVGHGQCPINASKTPRQSTSVHEGWPSNQLFPIIVIDVDAVNPSEIRTRLSKFPGAIVIAVSQSVSATQFNQLLRLRASAIISPGSLAESDLADFWQAQATREAWLAKFEPLVSLMRQLTPKERDILMQSRIYDSAPELAEALGLSTRTVEAHRYNIIRKATRGSFREWTVQLRLALLSLSRLGVDGEALLDNLPIRRRPRLLETV